MNNTDDLRTRLVPAVCTQCGAALEVDPSQEAAVCPYCNMPYIVEKAVRNYNIRNAKIEHADTVNIDMKGTADSFFRFLGTQLSESRAIRREERREEREEERAIHRAFFRFFGYAVIAMFVLAVIMILVQTIRGDFDETDSAAYSEEEAACFLLPENDAAGFRNLNKCSATESEYMIML